MSGAVQPYYAAWCRSQGVALEWQGPHTNHIYMAWIGARWAEFGFPIGSRLTAADREAFGQWLEQQYPEQICRTCAHYSAPQDCTLLDIETPPDHTCEEWKGLWGQVRDVGR